MSVEFISQLFQGIVRLILPNNDGSTAVLDVLRESNAEVASAEASLAPAAALLKGPVSPAQPIAVLQSPRPVLTSVLPSSISNNSSSQAKPPSPPIARLLAHHGSPDRPLPSELSSSSLSKSASPPSPMTTTRELQQHVVGSSDDKVHRPLHSAASQNNLALVTEILDNGSVNINKRNAHKRTALMGAAFFGHESMVKLLISRGADINAKCGDGATALIYATISNRPKVVQLLLDSGALRNMATRDGLTAYGIAKRANNTALAKLIEAQDMLTFVPQEIALAILSYLDVTSLLAASAVSRSWNKLCNDRAVWAQRCRRRNLSMSQLSMSQVVGRIPIDQLDAQMWKMLWAQRTTLERNWRTRKHQTMQLCKANGLVIVSPTLINNGDGIVTTSDLGRVAIWDFESAKIVDDLLYSGKIMAVATHHRGHVITGYSNGDIVVWCKRPKSSDNSLMNGESNYDHILLSKCHNDSVSAMSIDGDLLVTGSFDCRIKHWLITEEDGPANADNEGSGQHDSESKGRLKLRLEQTYDAHRGDVYCVKVKGKYVMSGGADQRARIWTNGQQIKRFAGGHNNAVTCVDFDYKADVAFSGSLDESVRVWKISSSQQIQVIEHGYGVRSLALHNDRLIIACFDPSRTVTVWENATSRSRRLAFTLRAFMSGRLSGMTVDDRRIALTTHDGQILVWDFQVGLDEITRFYMPIDRILASSPVLV